MALRLKNVKDVAAFAYHFESPFAVRATMADVGRTLGSQAIGLVIQTIDPGCRSSRRHRHLFQEEILVVMSGTGTLLHGDERVPVKPGDAVCYVAGDPEPHAFENDGAAPLVIWAFGNRFPYEVALYPDEGLAFVEGLGADVPVAAAARSEWTEERRRR
jgi:uncharacterized cupin superfamily protein